MTWYIDRGPDSDFIISSRIRLARNVRGYRFPNRMSPEEARQFVKTAEDAFMQANRGMSSRYTVVDLNELAPEERLSLAEKRLISEDLLKHSDSCGVVISRDEALSVMLGEEDHIRIQAMAPGFDLDKAYQEASRAAAVFEERLPVAYDEQYGFLTACPTNTGTGLRASVMIHLPALTELGQIRALIENLQKLGFTVRGNYGENSQATGYLYQISNQITLGLSETDLIRDLQQTVRQVMGLESQARQRLYGANQAKTEDRIYRALGTLSYARLISSEEALRLLSDLRLGVETGVLPQLKPEEVNRLTISIGPGTIQKAAGEPLDTTSRDRLRARLIRETLENAAAGPAAAD
ncbi:MAG: protein arginine kinase [Oscillospiraceae bacterium]|nr:protein arginine kinase [Oscillospiraceae bacterium]MDD4367433.1 protein arginine kinase [Oscillospiraceae bacterium]